MLLAFYTTLKARRGIRLGALSDLLSVLAWLKSFFILPSFSRRRLLRFPGIFPLPTTKTNGELCAILPHDATLNKIKEAFSQRNKNGVKSSSHTDCRHKCKMKKHRQAMHFDSFCFSSQGKRKEEAEEKTFFFILLLHNLSLDSFLMVKLFFLLIKFYLFLFHFDFSCETVVKKEREKFQEAF